MEDWVSRASALQRRGRAGRVRPGRCFGLYTRHRFEERMRKYQARPLPFVPSCLRAGHQILHLQQKFSHRKKLQGSYKIYQASA